MQPTGQQDELRFGGLGEPQAQVGVGFVRYRFAVLRNGLGAVDHRHQQACVPQLRDA